MSGPVRELLGAIVTLYRDGNCQLWGIPYRMRDDVQQSPRDLDRAGNRVGWVRVDESGRILAVREFLRVKAGDIPGNPYEWAYVSNRPHRERYSAFYSYGDGSFRGRVAAVFCQESATDPAAFVHVDADGAATVFREGAAIMLAADYHGDGTRLYAE